MVLKISDSKPIEILLAEDNPADARLTLEGFKDTEAKHNITVVADGQEVLDYLNRVCQDSDGTFPDLIILDLNMPKKSGHEVLADLKAIKELSVIPVIIFTASEDPDDIHEAYELHASAYLTKPIDFGEFKRLVRSIDEFWFHFVKLPTVVTNGN